jgi:hypothetical protein
MKYPDQVCILYIHGKHLIELLTSGYSLDKAPGCVRLLSRGSVLGFLGFLGFSKVLGGRVLEFQEIFKGFTMLRF